MERRLTCINCPLGCALHVIIDGSVIQVSGNSCPRGEIYGKSEVSHPVRMITTTLPVLNGKQAMVSCKSSEPIDKEKIFEVMRALKSVVVEAPVHIGEVLLENAAQTNVNIIATKNVEKAEKKMSFDIKTNTEEFLK
ncbi:hypothetical protein C815_00445 [Firmicutes bacterium M10-2]|nr:hypothetical protein C815_00445 [Firmicutes bacterium M10-2]